MFRRIFFTAIVAGLLGGLAISVVQEFTTTPLILHAEEFENSGGEGADKHSLRDRGISLIPPAHAHGPENAADAQAIYCRGSFSDRGNEFAGSGCENEGNRGETTGPANQGSGRAEVQGQVPRPLRKPYTATAALIWG